MDTPKTAITTRAPDVLSNPFDVRKIVATVTGIPLHYFVLLFEIDQVICAWLIFIGPKSVCQ